MYEINDRVLCNARGEGVVVVARKSAWDKNKAEIWVTFDNDLTRTVYFEDKNGDYIDSRGVGRLKTE